MSFVAASVRARSTDGDVLQMLHRALPAIGLGERHVPADGEGAPMIALRREHVGERLQHGEVVVLGDVRLLRCRDERVRRVVEVTARHRAASAFAKLVQIVEHSCRVESYSSLGRRSSPSYS